MFYSNVYAVHSLSVNESVFIESLRTLLLVGVRMYAECDYEAGDMYTYYASEHKRWYSW